MKYPTFFSYLTLSSILTLTPVKLGLAQTQNSLLNYQKIVQDQISHNLGNQINRLYQQGEKQLKAGQLQGALNSYQQALAIAKKMGNSQFLQGLILQRIGIVYGYLSEYKKALQNYEQAGKFFQAEGKTKDVAWTLIYIGNVFRDLQNFEEAEKFYQQALEISKKIGSRDVEGESINGLGSLYNIQEN